MKTLLKLSVAASILLLIVVGCQKMLDDDVAGSTKEFNAAFVREWYYGVFKKSVEFAVYDHKQNGLKEPDWKNGKYRKIGDMEIIEFPLMKERTILSIPSGNSLTSSEKARIANASLKRISFIKLPGKEITVRELDYIPEWEYLKLKNYDISSVELGSADNKFTGRIIVKKWNGKRLSVLKLNEGRMIKNTAKINKNKMQIEAASGYEGCYTPGVICDYEIICEHVVIGDIWMPPHSCTVGVCLGNCIIDEEPGPQCDFNSSVSCECQLYGLNCDGGGGTGGDNPQENNEGIANICKGSFLFNRYIQPQGNVGGWQVAGTEGIHMNIVDLTTGHFVPLYLPTMYFGLPVYRNGQYYSTNTAAEISAAAVEYAETQVMEYYHSIGGVLNAVGMTLFYREKMNNYMQANHSGSATLSPGLNINITGLGTATYGWPIIGCL